MSQPSSVDLQARRAALHEVLGVEVRAGGVRAADRLHGGQDALLPGGSEGREGGVEAEEAVEIQGRLPSAAAARWIAIVGRSRR